MHIVHEYSERKVTFLGEGLTADFPFHGSNLPKYVAPFGVLGILMYVDRYIYIYIFTSIYIYIYTIYI